MWGYILGIRGTSRDDSALERSDIQPWRLEFRSLHPHNNLRNPPMSCNPSSKQGRGRRITGAGWILAWMRKQEPQCQEETLTQKTIWRVVEETISHPLLALGEYTTHIHTCTHTERGYEILHYNTDEPEGHCTKWNKPGTKVATFIKTEVAWWLPRGFWVMGLRSYLTVA